MFDIASMQRDLPPEFDVMAAKMWLTDFKAPLKHLQALERSGAIIRLRRGLYAFSANFDRLAAAGSIHSPSYVSFETALSFYGLIPEGVETVMSVVDGRSAIFHTVAGIFQYYSQTVALFADGMTMVKLASNRSMLIANREKSLCDTLARADLRASICTDDEMWHYATGNLRIEASALTAMSTTKLRKLAYQYRNHGPRKLLHAIEKRKQRRA